LVTPAKVGRFVIDGIAGRGGMGTVYRGHDERTGERVAVKLVTDATDQGRARFSREAEALMRVNHIGVVRYVAHGATELGEPYLVMAWIDGIDLATQLRRGPLAVAAALELVRGVTNALAALHAQGLVHRDLKPQNILLADGDPTRPILVDLGIARQLGATAMTATGGILGTPQYMAPEQIESRADLDQRADLFALGCVLFECIVGRPVFVGDNAMAVLAKILVETAPTLAELGFALPVVDELLASLLEKSPARRPATALAIVAKLAACFDSLTTTEASTEATGQARAGVARLVTSREHRAITVAMASGIAGSSAGLVETMPADTPLDTMPAAAGDTAIQDVVRRHGGRLWDLGQDRTLLTFSGGKEAADQAAQAVRCASELVAAHPGALFALAVGSAQVEGVPVGDVINRVATLLERARPGHVRVDAASAYLLDVRFRLEAAGADFEIGRELDTVEPPRTLLGRQTRCVGRERELAMLIAAHDEVVGDGVARAVVVTAPSGTGKSRLRHELVQRLQRQASPATILVARAEALRADSPLDLLAGLIRAGTGIEQTDSAADARTKLVAAMQRRSSPLLDPEVPAFLGEIIGVQFPTEGNVRLASAREDTRLMGAQLTRAFVAWVDAETRARPLVLVLEDLHWGDHQTVRFLDAALRDLAERPLLVLALARPEVHERFPGLWSARAVASLNLGSLSKRACEQLVRDVLENVEPDLVEQIVKRSDGNAFYLEELVRAAAERDLSGSPVSVLAMVQARLEGLDGKVRRVLRAASVFGETFHRDGAVALLGGDMPIDVVSALEELVEREVIRREGGELQFAFRHALVREAAYAMLTPGDRQAAHGLAAEWLEAHGELDALLLAQHFDRAQDVVNATRCFARAARQALEKNDFEAVLVRAKHSMDLGATGHVLAEARTVRSKAFAGLGRWAEAEQELDTAVETMPADADDLRLEVLREMYFVATFRQSSFFFRKAGTGVMTLAERFGRPDLIVEANLALAVADHADERGDAGVDRFRRFIAGRGPRPSSVVGLSTIILYHAGYHAESVAICRELTTVAREMEDHGTLVILHANLGLSLAALGRYEEARASYAEARGLARKYGLASLEARSVSIAAGHHLDILDLEGAAAVARDACAIGKALEFSTPRISATIDLAYVAARTGSLNEAEDILVSIATHVERGAGFHGWLWRERVGVLRGELDLARGDFASALRRADASIIECRSHRRLKYETLAQIVRADALAGLGKKEEAASGLTDFLGTLAGADDPAIRMRTALAVLRHTREDHARTVAMDAATVIEAGLPSAERGAFRARFDALVRA
jgi:tetratricopeptide (TPR) repeat protein